MSPNRLRLGAAWQLATLLMKFVTRHVLHAGVLSTRAARLGAVALIALIAAACGTAATMFLSAFKNNDDVWTLLFDVSTVSLVLWMQIAFVLVKTLFLNAQGLLELSFQMPLTNRERALAFLIFEAGLAGLVAVAGFGATTVASVILLGPSSLGYIALSLALPAVIVYLALNVVYLALAQALRVVGLARVSSLILLMAMFGLILLYSARMGGLTGALTGAYLDKTTAWAWPAALHTAQREYGWAAALGAGLLAIAVLTALAIWLTPSTHVRQADYMKVASATRVHLGPYALCLLRNKNTLLAGILTLAAYVYLALNGPVSPIWAVSLLPMSALYQYASTSPLRLGMFGTTRPVVTYASLMRAQLGLLATALIPAAAVSFALPDASWSAAAQATAGCVASAILATFVSIAFPADHDNPFSVFVGLTLVGCLLGLVALGVGLLQVPAWAGISIVLAVLAVFVWYSIQGIALHESRKRHANDQDRHQQPRRSGARDARDRSRDPALPHVFNG